MNRLTSANDDKTLRLAKVRNDESTIVVQCGGVGRAVEFGAMLIGVEPLIAVDLSDDRVAGA